MARTRAQGRTSQAEAAGEETSARVHHLSLPVPVPGLGAFGAPGAAPCWAPGRKQAVGTALTRQSPVWFTVAQGVLTEVYYPRVDLANTRDLQFLLASEASGEFYEERRHTEATVELADPRVLLWDITTREPGGRFVIKKRLLTDPDRPCVVMRASIRAGEGGGAPSGLTPHILLAPHVADRGWGNNARLVTVGGRLVLAANRHDTYLALASSLPLGRASAGFVGASDGWTDLHDHQELTWSFAAAENGNVALVAALDGDTAQDFQLALGFGRSLAEAVHNALASADADFDRLQQAYTELWHRYTEGLQDLGRASGDGGHLYYLSAMVLRAHEDRDNPGAHIASLAVPWGETQGDGNRAGYHLVWPRDLYHTATAALAAGDAAAALRTLHYLARTQRADGSWPQNFWVFGEPYWHGLQLDEIAFPVLLAWQLRRAEALDWNPYPSLIAPAAYRIARVGPVTQEERWEENGGYSPSTLAVSIAALVCAAEFAEADRDPQAARYFLEVADYWATHLEDWTYTHAGSVPGHSEYYERIAGSLPKRPEQVGRSVLPVANLPPGVGTVQECAVVDGGFLELVRYGIRRPDDPHVLQSLSVYDQTCRVLTPVGPVWHRYTFDGYGEKAGGAPYDGTGIGRAWPLLTGERAHYELEAGRNPADLVRAMEAFVTDGGLLPEQVWDSPDIPERDLHLGRPSGSAAPLVWAHAEYIKLLRSIVDSIAFDCPPPVRLRYAEQGTTSNLVIWKHSHQVTQVSAGERLRLEVYAPAALHFTSDGWSTVHHEPAEPCGHGVWSYDFSPGDLAEGATLEFTFFWNDPQTWEGTNYEIHMV